MGALETLRSWLSPEHKIATSQRDKVEGVLGQTKMTEAERRVKEMEGQDVRIWSRTGKTFLTGKATLLKKSSGEQEAYVLVTYPHPTRPNKESVKAIKISEFLGWQDQENITETKMAS